MKKSDQKELAGSLLRLIPTKWAIVIVACLVGYVLLQPVLKQWLGWNLPSLASLGSNDVKPNATTKPNTSTKTTQPISKEPISKESTSKDDSANEARNDSKTQSSESERESTSLGTKEDQQPDEFLVKRGSQRFESPAGLIYGPGSAEGHRLKHIERHLKDIPNREGSHGVFDGSMVEFLKAIDDCYERAERGDKGTTKKEDDNAMIYEASFSKPIGFLGGQTGKKQKNPKLKRLKIVVGAKNAVITAFPVQ